LILNPDGSKMSKRDAGAAVGDYPRQGFLPGAVVNFIALLGWSSKTDEEIFTMEQLVERFSLENVNRAPARFDFEKCKWVNQQHLIPVSVEDFAVAAKPFVEEAGLPVTGNYGAVIAAVKEKVRLLSEVPAAVDFLLKDEFAYDGESVTKVRGNAAAKDLLAILAERFATITDWSADEAKAALNETAKSAGAKPGQLMFPLRVALSGRAHGPDIGDMLNLLGKERCTARVRSFSAML
jgi:glutamyl-tRNA synthetase